MMLKKIKLIIFTVILLNIVTSLSTQALIANNTPHRLIDEDLPNLEIYSTKLNSGLKLKDVKDKTYFIKIFSSWCSYCNKEMPIIKDIASKYNLPIYGILYKDNLDNINPEYRKIFKDILIESDSELFKQIGVKTIPDTLIIHKGRIIFHSRNSLNQKIIDDDIDKIIQYLTNNETDSI